MMPWCRRCHRELPKGIALKPAWNRPLTLLRHTWAGLVNIDQFRWLVRRDVQEQLVLAEREIGAKHVRAVGMFDDEMRAIGPDPRQWREKDPRPRTNFQIVDYVIDSLLDRGLQPMFTTTFMPGALAAGERTVFTTRSRVDPPRDMAEWARLVRSSVMHARDRYGLDVIGGWYYEVWNEPNLRNSFFSGTQTDFFELWRATRDAIKSVDADLRVGGPSTARVEWIPEFLDWSRSHDCAPDYLIAHIYGNDGASGALSPFDGPQEERETRSPHFASRAIRGTRRLLDKLGFRGELHWNEWGRTWHPCDELRESATEAAWIVTTMAEVSQTADRFAYWCLSDIYDQVGYGAEAFCGHYGMLSLQGLRKPSYIAHQLLERLGHKQVSTSGAGLDAHHHAMVTRDGDQVRVLVSALPDSAEAVPTPLSVEVPLPGRPAETPRLYRVGDRENNILATWRELGAPPVLSRAQTAALQAANGLTVATASAVRVEKGPGGWTATFSMENPGVALLETAMMGRS